MCVRTLEHVRSTAILWAVCAALSAWCATEAGAESAGITVSRCQVSVFEPGVNCCYAYTLCIDNAALPPVDEIELELRAATGCADWGSAAGWTVSRASEKAVTWQAPAPIALATGEALCGFILNAPDQETGVTVRLYACGKQVYESQLALGCANPCGVRLRPSAWASVQSLYRQGLL